MFKTAFKISKMDCPAEEQMIRMKLKGVAGIQDLKFDIPERVLEVYHTGGHGGILAALEDLQLDAKLVSSEATGPVSVEEDQQLQGRVLWQVLVINFFFFIR